MSVVNETQLRIESALWAIRQCWPEMHADAGWSEGGGRPAPGSRTPEPVGLLADRTTVAILCRQWCLWVKEHRNVCALTQTGPLDVMASTAFLLDHARWLGGQRRGSDAAASLERAGNICEVWAKGLHVRRIAVAPCPDCDGILFAILRQSDDVMPTVIRCDQAGHEYPPRTWQSLGRRLNGLHPQGIEHLRRVLRHVAS